MRHSRKYLHRGALAVFLSVVLLLAGFFYFTHMIRQLSPTSSQTADAIVALTGGKLRIEQAVELLKSRAGRRLLITGVHPTTSRQRLKKRSPQYGSLFECCIDIDHAARDTIGNAIAARSWVKSRHFKSLIIVTSSYHMPRSLVELQRQMPDIKLIPYSVNPKSFRIDSWWSHPGTLRLLISEYGKYISAMIRLAAARLTCSVSPAT